MVLITEVSKPLVPSWWWYTAWWWVTYFDLSPFIWCLSWVFLKASISLNLCSKTHLLERNVCIFPGLHRYKKSLFSAYYVIFLSFDNPNTPEGVDDSVSNPMPSPMESIMAMFLMSLTSFSDYYGAFDRTDHEIEAKVSFHRRTFKGEPNCGL